MHSATLAYGSVAAFCERDVSASGSIIRRELLHNPGYFQRQSKIIDPWSCSRVQCFVHGDVTDSEALSRLLPPNSNGP
jgi:hypothetical protein